MSSVTKRYRETVYGDEYEIEYRREPNGTYTIWCWEHPNNPYSAGVINCHLYPDGHVCIAAGREPRTLDNAIAIATIWTGGYSKYVRTGSFGATGGRVNV